MKRPLRILRIIAIILGSFILLAIIAGVVVSKIARKKFDIALAKSGIHISSLSVNLLTRSINIKNLEWSDPADSASARPHYAKLNSIYVGGISVFKLIRDREISVSELILETGVLEYNKAIHAKKDSAGNKSLKIKGITIDQLVIKDISLNIFEDSLKETSATLNITLDGINLADIGRSSDPKAYTMGSFIAKISNVSMNTRESMYSLKVAKVMFNSPDKAITVDSIVLLPKYSKYKFSRKIGKQVDRFVLRLPQLLIKGFNFDDLKDSLFTASLVEIKNADLQVYRDKRLPFIKNHNMPLPVAMIRELSFGVAVDTIKIIDAKIVYEEFPERGYDTGHLIFEKLNASLDHISNRDFYSSYEQATLAVTSRVMGSGVIKARFTLPYSKAQIYNAKGTITNLSLHRLNPMLESLAFISVEEGRLNQLDFDFDYNDISSNGKLLINYENLKLKGLNREKNPEKNDLKTWILNVFLKKDKDSDVSLEKRIGKIEYERDRRKAIFNVWVKSLFSGIKSSVIDTPAKKDLGQTPNERRDSLRKVEKKVNKDRRQVKREKVV
ncbi:MAG: DUF748 domain-containing protein [Chryseolinea sp.]